MAVLIDADSRILLQGPIAPEGRAGAAAPSSRLLRAACESVEARCGETGSVVSFEAAAAARQARVLARAGAAGAIFVETPARIGQTPQAAFGRPARARQEGGGQGGRGQAYGAPWDFAAAIREVEREYYGPVLRVVECGVPRISS